MRLLPLLLHLFNSLPSTAAVAAAATPARVVVAAAVVASVADAWENMDASRHLFRGSFEESLKQLLEEEEQLVAPRPSSEACMAAYRWVAGASIVLCLLSLSVVGLGSARDARDYTASGLSSAGLGRPPARVNPLDVRVLPEVDTERLVGLTRRAWLTARGVISRRSAENKRFRRLF